MPSDQSISHTAVYDYRRAWIDLTGRLASGGGRTGLAAAIAGAYRDIFGFGVASLYLPGPFPGVFTPAGPGQPHPGCAVSDRLLSFFLDGNRIWNPADTGHEPTEQEALFVRASGARLVVPLLCDGRLEGLVALGTGADGSPFTFEDYDLMKIIAQQSALLLSNLRLSDELIEMRELAAMARVSSFVVHDLKNLTCTLSLLIDNAEQHMADEAFQRDLIGSIRQTAGSMKKLTQKLGKFRHRSASRPQVQDIGLLCRTVIEEFRKSRPRAVLVQRGRPAACGVDGEEFRTVIVNLVQNGIDAAGDAGSVIIETGQSSDKAFLSVADTGCGMPGEFIRSNLFRPFRTTKKGGLGIGLYQCRQIVESAGGSIEVLSEAGKGSTFTVYVPAAARVQASAS